MENWYFELFLSNRSETEWTSVSEDVAALATAPVCPKTCNTTTKGHICKWSVNTLLWITAKYSWEIPCRDQKPRLSPAGFFGLSTLKITHGLYFVVKIQLVIICHFSSNISWHPALLPVSVQIFCCLARLVSVPLSPCFHERFLPWFCLLYWSEVFSRVNTVKGSERDSNPRKKKVQVSGQVVLRPHLH